jgi:glycosyltransferase involved in cell wall biosynthesis
MRVLYDHQAFTIQDYGGISRYFFELTKQFQTYPELKISGSLLFSNNELIQGNEIFSSTSFFKGLGSFQKKTELMNLLNQLKSKAILRHDDFDIFHPTYYDPYYLKSKIKKPIVITFHDLIHEKFKQLDHRTLAHKKRVLSLASQIIAVSQSSKNDLMEYYGIKDERITVVHLASSIARREDLTADKPKIDYLLYVGNRGHYKNFLFFVRAIAPLLIKESNLFLYCAGGGSFTKEESILFQELHIQNKVTLHAGNDASLTKIYSNAVALMFPSLYEGFGLPLIEAMSCGCPIGASQTSSLPEVANDAALYFDPYDQDSILSVAKTLISNSDIRLSLRQKGFLRAQKFTWKKTAALTHQVYSSVV